ncbi:uncharacterized protein DMAD_02808 [Drosophila madeirensis]|uniref:Uncharacterized protein n=1 Tax=Drosophila madeirensis TaxID=30013 RepID=A0AAU9G7V5_DROMD
MEGFFNVTHLRIGGPVFMEVFSFPHMMVQQQQQSPHPQQHGQQGQQQQPFSFGGGAGGDCTMTVVAGCGATCTTSTTRVRWSMFRSFTVLGLSEATCCTERVLCGTGQYAGFYY